MAPGVATWNSVSFFRDGFTLTLRAHPGGLTPSCPGPLECLRLRAAGEAAGEAAGTRLLGWLPGTCP